MLRTRDLHCDFFSLEKFGRKGPKKKYKLLCQEIGVREKGFLVFSTTSETFFRGKQSFYEITPDCWVKENNKKCFQSLFKFSSFIDLRKGPEYYTEIQIRKKMADCRNKFPYVTTLARQQFDELLDKAKLYINKSYFPSEYTIELIDENKLSKEKFKELVAL